MLFLSKYESLNEKSYESLSNVENSDLVDQGHIKVNVITKPSNMLVMSQVMRCRTMR